MRKHLLVAIDFGENSSAVLEHTLDLARFIDGTILLLHVIDTGYYLGHFLHNDPHRHEKMKGDAKERLDKITEPYKRQGIPFEIRVEEGKVYEKILSVSEEINARFIIIGKNESKQNQRELLGSNATQVVRGSKVPVISFSGNARLGYRHIVLPLDLTKKTREQLFNAISFGIHYKATIHIVSVLIAGISARKSLIWRKMKKVQKTLQENGVETTIQLFKRSEKEPYKVVIEYSQNLDADLIMVMTHKEDSAYDNYIGAFAHQIINESEIPVLSLTSAAAKEEENNLVQTLADPFGILKNVSERKILALFRRI